MVYSFLVMLWTSQQKQVSVWFYLLGIPPVFLGCSEYYVKKSDPLKNTVCLQIQKIEQNL